MALQSVSRQRPATEGMREKRHGYEGIAATCLIAVAFSFLIIKDDVPLDAQEWLWFIFVIVSGLCLSITPPLSTRRLILPTVPCCVVLFLGLIFQGVLGVIWNSVYIRILSMPPVPSNDTLLLIRAGFWYLFLFVATVPAVILAGLAKSMIMNWIKTAAGFDPKRLSRIEKLINTVIRIAGVLGFGFLVTR